MASIAGFTVTVWKGRLRRATVRTSTLEGEPGVRGVAVAIGEWTTAVDEIETQLDGGATYAAARTIAEAYRNLMAPANNVVTVVDQFGETWPAVTVLSVVAEPSYNLATGQWRVVAFWRLLPSVALPGAL